MTWFLMTSWPSPGYWLLHDNLSKQPNIAQPQILFIDLTRFKLDLLVDQDENLTSVLQLIVRVCLSQKQAVYVKKKTK